MKTYTYRMLIEPDEDGYHGFAPLLKGVHTGGKTIKEAKKNLQEAIQCHIEGLKKDNKYIPQEENKLEVIQAFNLHA